MIFFGLAQAKRGQLDSEVRPKMASELLIL